MLPSVSTAISEKAFDAAATDFALKGDFHEPKGSRIFPVFGIVKIKTTFTLILFCQLESNVGLEKCDRV
jgi:hypothetical protein